MTRARAALLVGTLVLAVAAPAAAAEARVSGTVRLASQTAWVTGAGVFELHVAVETKRPATLDLVIDVHGPVKTRSEFTNTIAGRFLRRSIKRLVLPVAQLPVDGDGSFVVSLPMPRLDTPVSPQTLPPLAAGVYPVSVEARVHEGGTVDELVTHLVRLPDDPVAAPLAVAWLQPVHRSPGVIAAVGDANLPLTLDVTPADVDGLPPETLQPLQRAVEGGDHLLASTYVPVDATALVAAGRGDDLALQRQVGDDSLLASTGARGDLRTWSADRPLSGAALARLRQLGVTRLVLPESSLEPLPASVTGQLTLTRPFAVDAGNDDVIDGVAVDDSMRAHFHNRGDRVLAAHQLLADLAVLYFDAPGNPRGVVVRAPQTWSASPAFLRTAFGAISQATVLRAVTVAELFETVPPLTSRRIPVVRSLTSNRVAPLPTAALARAHDALDELTALVGPATERAEVARRELLAAESLTLTSAQRTAALSEVVGSLSELRGKLRMPHNRTIRLTAREGTIPVQIVNDNPFPVHVQLVLSSEKLEFAGVDGADRTQQVFRELILQPGNNPRTVTVRARASAAFSMRALLLAPNGSELVRSRFTIVSTVFSGVGVVLSIVSALFLLVWWGRHWRTVRRDRRLVSAPRADARR
jgi:hypothetical protein